LLDIRAGSDEELINDYIRNTKLENVLNEQEANLCEGQLTARML